MGASVLPFPTSIIPSEAVALLRTRRTGKHSSGFRNVYYAGTDEFGSPTWKAKVKRGRATHTIPGSRDTQPQVVAMYVVAWYEQTFGPRWRDVLQARKVNPFTVKQRADKRYYAAVWVAGRREEVVRLRQCEGGELVADTAGRPERFERRRWYERTLRLRTFKSHDAAKRGIKSYMEQLYGPRWRTLLYRLERIRRAA